MVDLGHNKDFSAAERNRIFGMYRAGWADVCRAMDISPHSLGTIDPAVIVAVILIQIHNRLIDLEARIVQIEGRIVLPSDILKG